jgi:repressor LexA
MLLFGDYSEDSNHPVPLFFILCLDKRNLFVYTYLERGANVLTKKQKKFYDNLSAYVRKDDYFPSVREIGRLLGFSSPATVHTYMKKLLEKGYLRRDNHQWSLTARERYVPLVGIVPAGSPQEIFENLGDEVELPEWLVDGRRDVVAFIVSGESMRDAYIQEGDVVVVRRAKNAENGEMVVAVLEDKSITLKRLKKEKKKFWLVPENPDYQSIHDPFQLVGKVVGVLRKYR